MRIPLVRYGTDVRPIQKWEWIFAPIIIPVFLVCLSIAALVGIPYFWLYPERHKNVADMRGTDEEKRKLAAFREYRRRVGVGRRVLERLHLVPFDFPPNENAVSEECHNEPSPRWTGGRLLAIINGFLRVGRADRCRPFHSAARRSLIGKSVFGSTEEIGTRKRSAPLRPMTMAGRTLRLVKAVNKLPDEQPESPPAPPMGKTPRLFNPDQDLGETNDLASSEPKRVSDMQARWDKWNAGLVPPAWGEYEGGENVGKNKKR